MSSERKVPRDYFVTVNLFAALVIIYGLVLLTVSENRQLYTHEGLSCTPGQLLYPLGLWIRYEDGKFSAHAQICDNF